MSSRIRILALVSLVLLSPGRPAVGADSAGGDVAVTVRGSTLVLRGGSTGECVSCTGGLDGAIVVAGQNGTTVNGDAAAVEFDGVRSIRVDLRGGDDVLALDALTLDRTITIATGGGDDDVAATDCSAARLRVATGSGTDSVQLTRCVVDGRALVNGGGREGRFEERDRLRVVGGDLPRLRVARAHRVAREESVTNGRLTIGLEFVGELELQRGERRAWDLAESAPYVVAAERWLAVLRGAGELPAHTVTVTVFVRSSGGRFLGAATPLFEDAVRVGDDLFPTRGSVQVSSFMYSEGARREFGALYDAEFAGNIEHEIGHVLGIGSLFTLTEFDGLLVPGGRRAEVRAWVAPSRDHDGWIYQQPAGVAAYNAIFGTAFDFVPIQNGGGHFWIPTRRADTRRDPVGVLIPAPTRELMAPGGGLALSILTLGVLDDMGWDVDASQADPYRAEDPFAVPGVARSRPRCACAR